MRFINMPECVCCLMHNSEKAITTSMKSLQKSCVFFSEKQILSKWEQNVIHIILPSLQYTCWYGYVVISSLLVVVHVAEFQLSAQCHYLDTHYFITLVLSFIILIWLHLFKQSKYLCSSEVIVFSVHLAICACTWQFLKPLKLCINYLTY